MDMPEHLDLSSTQARVLGALIEKAMTTPDGYPLTLNALTTACNQTSNRDPVVHYETSAVETAVLALKVNGLARIVHPGAGERSTKYRHVADEALDLDAPERALLGVLLLRGAQTVAELRSRSERMYTFKSADEVEEALTGMARREPALVARVDRTPGQKEGRWIQLLEVGAAERAAAGSATAASVTPRAGADRVASLEARVEALEAQLRSLAEALGTDLPD